MKDPLANDLQALWKGHTRDLSLAVLTRMLLQTARGQVDGLNLKPKLCGRVWPAEKMEPHAGIPCSLSARLKTEAR